MESGDDNMDLTEGVYQHIDSTKEIWKALQDMKLGAGSDLWSIHEDARRVFHKDHRTCLVAMGLNPYHQNPAGLKAALPRAWQLTGRVESQINDDGTVNFYFESEHHILMVLEKAPYTYRGWLVALDRWSNRSYPDFLRNIPFKVKILNLPNMYRRPEIVRSIGSKLGQVREVSIIEPTVNRAAEVSVKIDFDIDDPVIFTKEVEIFTNIPPVELGFRYTGLQKFCIICGSLRHEFEVCKDAALLTRRQMELLDTGTNPYLSAEERSSAIRQYLSIRQEGETSRTATGAQTTEEEATVGIITPVGTGARPNAPMESTTLAGSSVAPEEQGTKRKAPEADNEENERAPKRLVLNQSELEETQGLVVLHKPPPQP